MSEHWCLTSNFVRRAVDSCAVGAYCMLRNVKVDMYRGSMRLVLDQWAHIEPASSARFEAKVRLQPHGAPCGGAH